MKKLPQKNKNNRHPLSRDGLIGNMWRSTTSRAERGIFVWALTDGYRLTIDTHGSGWPGADQPGHLDHLQALLFRHPHISHCLRVWLSTKEATTE
jgi:hypothetical protein